MKRTRANLQGSLFKLLGQKPFESISVQDITEEATINRATFYAHSTDKYELLNAMTAERFRALLEDRGVRFDGTCDSALPIIFLGVCDYLTQTVDGPRRRKLAMDPYLEAAILTVVRGMSIEGLKQQPWKGRLPLELVATSVSWALYGAATGWVYLSKRPRAEMIAEDVVAILVPMIHRTVLKSTH